MGAGGGKICAAIGAENVKAALVAAGQAVDADVIEIRLDSLADPAVAPFMAEIKKPLLFTNRPKWEGGDFAGEETARLPILLEAVNANAAYVDIELNTDAELRQPLFTAAKSTDTKLIMSWHDFNLTPSDRALATIFQQMYRSGADIGKIVTTANSFHDVLRVLQLQEMAAEMDFPLCAFCMGEAGKISRLATLQLNGYMTYAALDADSATAPGQLSLAAIKQIVEILQ